MKTRTILGLLLIILGLSALFDFPFFKIFFSVVLIFIGYRVLTGKAGRDFTRDEAETEEENQIRKVWVFSGSRKKYASSDFRGGEMVAVFSGAEIDLRGAKTKIKELDLNLVAVFGGLKVLVPQNWQIHSEGVGIAGSFENKTKSLAKNTAIVNLRGAAIFGGVEVIN